MAVTIRLSRVGGHGEPKYRIVAKDKRAKRDGRFLEILGHYIPVPDKKGAPPVIELNVDALKRRLSQGAELSDTVRSLAKKKGVTV